MEFEKGTKITLYRYDEDTHDSVAYDVQLYDIPLNKKGFCQATTFIELKSGVKEVSKCQNWKNKNSCSECIKLAKELYRVNH